MVACPCALALVAPFTYGTLLRSFGRHHLYLKNVDVIERLANIDAVVFDKTGTVTFNQQPEVSFVGHLSIEEMSWVKGLTSGSTHPLSKLISNGTIENQVEIESFKEFPGRGIEGVVSGNRIKIGSALFTNSTSINKNCATQVFISINGEPRGYFSVSLNLRNDLKPMITWLGEKSAALLSGDNETDKSKMKLLFGCRTALLFNQSPHDKLNYIRDLQNSGKKVLMIGDGLNDSGALKQADVGIAVTDDTGIFTPACDGIIQGSQLKKLNQILELANSSSNILKTGFIISFLYNAVALSFAVAGHLSPIIAAILMPLSSISVVAFSSLAVTWMTNRKLSPA
jgi:Cu+-exporting ATPase